MTTQHTVTTLVMTGRHTRANEWQQCGNIKNMMRDNGPVLMMEQQPGFSQGSHANDCRS
ncbi:MAG: hypothetical protein ABGZ53_30245 [Fuerstiella sp.]